jgi:hypothetical protein
MNDYTRCQGNCMETHGSHSGEVYEVIVSGYSWKPTTFLYCQTAIDEDKRRGFDVFIKPNSEQNPERSVATEAQSGNEKPET